jgi:hypothetical protein
MIIGRVIRIIDERTLVLNVGERDGVEGGMRFTIVTPPTEIVDPETKEHLGDYRQRKATVVARSVYERFTITRPDVLGLGSFARVFGTATEQKLPIDRSYIEPMPTGSQIIVGDRAEEVVTVGAPPIQAHASAPAPTLEIEKGDADAEEQQVETTQDNDT